MLTGKGKLTTKWFLLAATAFLGVFMLINLGIIQMLMKGKDPACQDITSTLENRLKEALEARESASTRLGETEAQLLPLSNQVQALQDLVANLKIAIERRGEEWPAVKLPIAVIVFTYNRPNYLEDTLKSLYKYLPPDEFAIIVSQDDDKPAVTEKISQWKAAYPTMVHIQHLEREDPKKYFKFASENPVYYYISQHYGYALGYVFDRLQYQSAILLEEDIIIAPDFYDYFKAMQPVLFQDPTLLCVSAWNDNGRKKLVRDPMAVERTNFFPGLGWMLTKRLWHEIGYKWPHGYWDDWLREPDQRKDRDCVHPEISRTYTIGKEGSSGGQFYDSFLREILLNPEPVNFANFNRSSLLQANFEATFVDLVRRAVEIARPADAEQHSNSTLLLYYDGTERDFATYADKFNLMKDFKAGVPRMGYHGTVKFWSGSNLILLAPKGLKSKLHLN